MDVEQCQVVGAHQELSICLGAQCLEKWQSFFLVLVDLFDVLATAQHESEQVAKVLVEFLHLDAHPCGHHRVGGHELDSTGEVGLQGDLGNDTTLGKQLTLGSLEDRDHAAVELQVPFGLVGEVDLAILELDLLGREGVAGAGDERAQGVAVHAQVGRVGGGLGGLDAAFVEHALQSVVAV